MVGPHLTISNIGESAEEPEDELELNMLQQYVLYGHAEEAPELWLKNNNTSRNGESWNVDGKLVLPLWEKLSTLKNKNFGIIAVIVEVKDPSTTSETELVS